MIILLELSLFGQCLSEVRLQIMDVIGHARIQTDYDKEIEGTIEYLFARTRSPSMYLVQT